MDERHTKALKLSKGINDLVKQINTKLAELKDCDLHVDFKYETSNNYPHNPGLTYRGWLEL